VTPRAPETMVDAGPSRPPSAPSGRVLVVDDRQPLRQAVAFALRESGLDVVEAATGAEALRAVRDSRPDLVLLDVRLPDIDGREVCRRIKADPDLGHTLVMHLSATNWTSADQVEALDGGADGYVTRPVDDRELLARVRAMLRLAAAERAMRETEQRLLLIARSAQDVIVLLDPDGAIRYVSPSVTASLGYLPEELTGTPFSAVLHDEDRRTAGAAFGDIIANGSSHRIEVRARHRDGSWRSFELRGALARDDGGAVRHLVAVARDITERRQAEAALRESEQRFRLIADNAHDVIAMLDLDWSIVYLSPSYRRAIGTRAGDLKGLDSLRWVHPNDRDAVRERLEEVVRTRQAGTAEFRHVSPTGGWSTFEATASCVVDQAGDPRYVVVVSRDVSERRALEQQLRQSQKLEAVARLAGGMAHEFANAMQAMLATIAVARRNPPERTADALAEIERLLGQSAATVHKLLFFARPEMARSTALDLNAAVGAVEGLVRGTVPAGVEVRLDLAPSPLPVRGDPAQLELAVLNLVNNSVDAMPGGGRLTLRTGDDGAGGVWLEVADTGAGMTADVRARLFEPFFTTKGSERGTGLGLPVTQRTVHALGGRIDVRSAPGEGSTFRIVLPRGASPAGEDTVVPAGEPRGAGERVLVVEDEDDARRGLVELLAMLGYVVVEAASGTEALEAAGRATFDALVTDLRLPGVPGGELARELLGRWPRLAVILMSGYPQEAAALELLRAGQARFLQKPFGLDALVRELRDALDEAASEG